MGFTIRPLTPEQWPALEQLFGKGGASNGCWCMYWRLGPRYHDRLRELNQQDRRQLTARQPAPGLLAFDGDVAVGWAELAPRADLAWLNQTKFLRPVDDLPVWSVPCFYVGRTHRGLGVMGALIAGAVQAASAAGAPALESYPVDTQVAGHTGNLFPGVASTFAAHGFEVVARRKPDRPVMRRETGGCALPWPGDRYRRDRRADPEALRHDHRRRREPQSGQGGALRARAHAGARLAHHPG